MPTPMGDFHHPDKLVDSNDFKTKYAKAINYVSDGLPPQEACTLVFGVAKRTFRKWVEWAMEDIEAGFDESESNLIKLMIGLAQEDAKLHKRISETAISIAVDERNTQMIQFLLKTRFGYAEKSKSEVEVSTDDETNFNINIIESKPKDD